MIFLDEFDKAEVLVALYENAKKVDKNFNDCWDYLEINVARKLLNKNNNEVMFYKNRYLGFAAYGYPLRFCETLYDRYNGKGKAKEVIETLRKRKNIDIL